MNFVKMSFWAKYGFRIFACLFTLGVLILFLLNWGPIRYSGDNVTYLQVARSIFTAKPFVLNFIGYFYFPHPIEYPHYVFQPLFPIFLSIGSLISQSFGPMAEFTTGAVTNVLITVGALWGFLALLGQLGIQSRWLLFLGTLLFLGFPSLFLNTMVVHSEPAYLCVLFLHLNFLIYSVKNHRSFWIPGALLGLVYLTRPNGLFVLIADSMYLLLNFVLIEKRSWKDTAKNGVHFLIGFFAVLSPWFLRNYVIFGDPTFSVYKFQVWLDSNDFSVWASPPNLKWYLSQHSLMDFFFQWRSRMKEMWTFFMAEPWKWLVFMGLAGVPFYKRKEWVFALLFLCLVILEAIGQGFHFFVTDRHVLTFSWVFVVFAVLGLQLIEERWLAKRRWHTTLAKIAFIGLSFFASSKAFVPWHQTCWSEYLRFRNLSELDQKILAVSEWMKDHTAITDAVMTTVPPDGASYYTGHPTIGTPTNMTESQFAELQERLGFKYFIAGNSYKVLNNLNFIVPNNFVRVDSFEVLGESFEVYKLQSER